MVNFEHCYGWTQGFKSRYYWDFYVLETPTNCLERFLAWVSIIRRESTREESTGLFFAIIDEGACRSGEGGEKSLLGQPGI